jgi:hypothetical protein
MRTPVVTSFCVAARLLCWLSIVVTDCVYIQLVERRMAVYPLIAEIRLLKMVCEVEITCAEA